MNILFQLFLLSMQYGQLKESMGKLGKFIIWTLVFIGAVLLFRAWLLDYRCKKMNEERESEKDD